MTETITCERLHDGHSLHGRSRLVIDGGTIVAIEPSRTTGDVSLVTPGLVDLQINGWDDVDVSTAGADDLVRLNDALRDMGTTSWLGTLITAPLDDMRRRVDALDQAVGRGAAPGMVGIHLEGPFLGGAPGAHRRRHIVPVDEGWLGRLPPIVRMVTLAPETTGAIAAIRRLVDRGVRVSLGHSTAGDAELDEAVRAGATMVTHLFNGMSGVHHRDGGLALWALTTPSVSLGLIADMVHVSPRAVRLGFGAGAPARVHLVSDTIAWRSKWAETSGLELSNGAPRLPGGTLAGSCTPLSACVRLAVTEAGIDLSDAVRAATSWPADLIGRADLGRIHPGRAADIVMFDETLHVVGHRSRLPSVRAHTIDP